MVPPEDRDRFAKLYAWRKRAPLIKLAHIVVHGFDLNDRLAVHRVLQCQELLRLTALFL